LDLRPIAGGFALFSMAAASSAASVHDFTVKVRKTAQSPV
jgi:glutathione peroxidase